MKIFPVGASLVGALALSLVACGDDSSSNVSENRPSSYENTSSSSGDTIAYATPPTLSCENVSFLPVYRGEEGTVLDSSYSVKQIIFRENGDVVLLGDVQDYEQTKGFGVWTDEYYFGNDYNTNESAFMYYGLCTKGKTSIVQRRSPDGMYKICVSKDDAESWNCSLSDSNLYYLACDDDYFYLQKDNNITYSADGITWNALDFPDSTINELVSGNRIRNAFSEDSLHFIFMTSGAYLLYSSDMVHWNYATVPVTQSGTKIAYGNGVYVYAGAWGQLLYSTDLVEWKKTNIVCESCSPWYEDIIFANGMFVAVGSANSFTTSKILMTSKNGKDFAAQDACGPASDYDLVRYGNGKFYVLNGWSLITFQTEP